MNSIAFHGENEKHFSTRIREFFRRYRIGGILKKSNAYKEQGVSVVALIEYGSVSHVIISTQSQIFNDEITT